jgi:hypothetical protein
MKRIFETLLPRTNRRSPIRPRAVSRVPELPLGFVSRTDPNFYFLSRKF